jgi:hypothetical protein
MIKFHAVKPWLYGLHWHAAAFAPPHPNGTANHAVLRWLLNAVCNILEMSIHIICLVIPWVKKSVDCSILVQIKGIFTQVKMDTFHDTASTSETTFPRNRYLVVIQNNWFCTNLLLLITSTVFLGPCCCCYYYYYKNNSLQHKLQYSKCIQTLFCNIFSSLTQYVIHLIFWIITWSDSPFLHTVQRNEALLYYALVNYWLHHGSCISRYSLYTDLFPRTIISVSMKFRFQNMEHSSYPTVHIRKYDNTGHIRKMVPHIKYKH